MHDKCVNCNGPFILPAPVPCLCEPCWMKLFEPYEVLRKLVLEWQAAREEYRCLLGGDPRYAQVVIRCSNADDALKAWKAPS